MRLPLLDGPPSPIFGAAQATAVFVTSNGRPKERAAFQDCLLPARPIDDSRSLFRLIERLLTDPNDTSQPIT